MHAQTADKSLPARHCFRDPLAQEQSTNSLSLQNLMKMDEKAYKLGTDPFVCG